MQKIKVLHIIKSLGRGGAEMLLAETIKLHDHSRFEFYCVYFLPWKNQMVDKIEEAGGKVICFSAGNNLQILSKYEKIIKFCRDERICLIHSHLPWSGFLGRLVYAKTKIPVIYTEHNIQEHYHFVTKIINRISFNSQSLGIGVSADVTRSINENINPSITVKTVLNGVNTEKFLRNSVKGQRIRKVYNIPLNAIVIGNIAVFREQKSILDWVKAFNEVHKTHPEVYGVLVGTGPEKDKIVELIAEFGLMDRIRLTGLQTDTVAYFSAMDIYMMSSIFEGLPIALLEAMSMECAIVSTKAGGVVEVIRNEKDGLLCEVGDYYSLGNKVVQLVSNPEERERFQLQARKRVKHNFSLAAMVTSLETVYNDTIKHAD